jgi:hypothetical protein
MKFEHDIFIGYASASGSESSSISEWSLKFCEYLTALMEKLYEKKPSIMLHDDLRVRQSMLGENFRNVIQGTAIVVIILSPEYSRSGMYMKEINDIIATLKDHELATGTRHRIFKVLHQPVPSEEQPAELKEELNYNFYEINRYNKKAISYDLSGKTEPDQKFWSKLVDLAYDISEAYSDITGEPAKKTAVLNDKPAVFLADTSFDQAENRDMLKRELQHLGFRVLPNTQIPDDAEKAAALIESNLEQSVMAIHLLGAWYGDFIKNSKYSFIDFQIKTVKDYLSNRKDHMANQLIWIPNDIKPTDQRQALYLKRLKRDEAQYDTEIIETPFEVFKTILNARLHERISPKVVPAAEKNKLYVIYGSESRDHITGYLQQIKSKGFEILEPVGDHVNHYPLTQHINNLLVADAVLIYKGDCPMEWLNSKIRDLVKAPGYGKTKPFRAIEIISKQKTADKSLLFLNNVPVNWDDEVNTEVITHFLDHLAKK